MLPMHPRMVLQRKWIRAVHRGDDAAVAQILAEEPEPVMSDVDTALQEAAMSGHDKVVAQLLTVANPKVADVKGWTALHYAVDGGHERVVEQLLAVSNLEMQTNTDQGGNVIHLAARRNHIKIMEQLLAVAPTAVVGAFDDHHSTALHEAAKTGHDEIVELLLAACPSLIDELDRRDRTALHYAVIHGHEEVAERLIAIRPELVSKADSSGTTVFHAACHGGCRSRALLSRLYQLHPESLQARESMFGTPFSAAISYRNEVAIEFLQWRLTFDELQSGFHDQSEVRRRYLPLVQRESEGLLELLNKDLVGIVEEYLFFRL